MRHQISVSANASRDLEGKIKAAEERVADVTADLSVELSPEQLLRRNQEFELGLVRPRENQVVRVADEVESRLAAKRFGQLLTAADSVSGVAMEGRNSQK